MIKVELFGTWEDGTKLIKTYSDKEKLIRQIDTGMLFSEAIDVEDSGHTYEETDQYKDSLVQAEHDVEILKAEIEMEAAIVLNGPRKIAPASTSSVSENDEERELTEKEQKLQELLQWIEEEKRHREEDARREAEFLKEEANK